MPTKQFPKVVVGGFIRNDKGEVFLVKSHKWPGKWVVMGGHIGWGETIESALIREVKEETELDVAYDRVIEVVEFVNSKDFYKPTHIVALQCECHLVGDQKPKLDGRELQVYRWFSLSDALKLDNLLDVTRRTLTLLN